MKPKSKWFWYWMAWIAAFLVPEALAWPLTLALAALFAFLIYHFLIDRRSRK